MKYMLLIYGNEEAFSSVGAETLAEIIRETRELWKLVVVQADQAELEAKLAELDRLTRADFDRRREEA